MLSDVVGSSDSAISDDDAMTVSSTITVLVRTVMKTVYCKVSKKQIQSSHQSSELCMYDRTQSSKCAAAADISVTG